MGRGLDEFVVFASRAREQIPPGSVDWSESPFAWMRHHGPRTKSKMGRDIAVAWLDARGVPWKEPDNAVCHFVVPRLGRVVAQLSILGKEGRFEFAQLREPGLGTDAIWMIGVEPHRVRLWGAKPSSVVDLPSYAMHQPGYHHCSFDPEEPPEWLTLLDEWSDHEA